MGNLVLLRHGQSVWNLENRFTGWYDCGLSEQGVGEAVSAGRTLRDSGLVPDVIFTSVLQRATETARLAAEVVFGGDGDGAGGAVPEFQRDWRLNERHYGNLTGLNKAETAEQYGDEQVHIWRRSYSVQPPPITPDNPWNPNGSELYAGIDDIPLTECLADVTVRMLPCFAERIAPELRGGKLVLVVAHGNSLRALVKHLDGIADADIAGINIPTGVPFIYELVEAEGEADAAGGGLVPREQLALEQRYLT